MKQKIITKSLIIIVNNNYNIKICRKSKKLFLDILIDCNINDLEINLIPDKIPLYIHRELIYVITQLQNEFNRKI